MAIKRKVPKNSTPVHNDIIEKMALSKLTMYETRIIMAVIRKTYGWDKNKDWITGSQLSNLTGIRENHCYKTVENLLKKHILIKDGKRIGLNKRTNQWLVHEGVVHQDVVHQRVKNSTPACSQTVHQDVHTKETITKETIQKKKLYKKDLNISLVDEGTKQKRKSSAKKKKEYELLGEFENIKLTKEEQVKLRQRHGVQETENAIVEMSLWLKQNNKTYKDYYAALLNWIRRHKEKTNPTKVKPKCLTHEDL